MHGASLHGALGVRFSGWPRAGPRGHERDKQLPPRLVDLYACTEERLRHFGREVTVTIPPLAGHLE